MATPIAETPILEGAEAEKFIQELMGSQNKMIPIEVFNETKRIYDKLRNDALNTLDF